MAKQTTDGNSTAGELEQRFLDFCAAHPELNDALGLWMASGETLEATNPQAAAIFAKEFPELKG